MVAEARKPIRISGMLRQMLYANAVAKRAQERGLRRDGECIPLPGLADPETQLGIPLLVRDELVGVLCIEADTPYRFHEEDRAYLELLGGYLAMAIQNTLLRERTEEAEEPSPARPRPDEATGCVDCTNRRLRLDKSLQLPEVRDNLESRLILLRRRLDERCPASRIVQSGRGRFRLELSGEAALVERP
jgi:adenylate cyclase